MTPVPPATASTGSSTLPVHTSQPVWPAPRTAASSPHATARPGSETASASARLARIMIERTIAQYRTQTSSLASSSVSSVTPEPASALICATVAGFALYAALPFQTMSASAK